MQALIDYYAKSTSRSRLVTLAAMGLVAGAAAYSWLVHPHMQSLQAAQAFTKRADTISKKMQQLAGAAQIARTGLDKVTARLSETQKQLFTFEESQAFFTNLEQLAGKSGCSVTSVKLICDDAERKDPNAVVTLSRAAVNISGAYGGITQFLTDIKTLPKRVSVSDMAITAMNDKSSRVNCSMVIGLYIIESKGAVVK